MSEDIKQVEMYCYTVNGVELWTSNEVFANIRANEHNSKIYVETFEINE